MTQVIRTNAEKRMARVRVLVDELRAKSGALDDEKCRRRCLKIVDELAGLLQAEERHQRHTIPIAQAAHSVQKPETVTHDLTTAVKQSEFTGLYVSLERHHRKTR